MKKGYLALFIALIISMIYPTIAPIEVEAFEEYIPPTTQVYNTVTPRTIAFHGNAVPGYTTIVVRTEKPTRGHINVYGSNGISTKINLSTTDYKTEHVVHWAPWNDSTKAPLPLGEYTLRLDVTDPDYNRSVGLSLGKITVVAEPNPKPLIEILEVNPSEVIAKPGEQPVVKVTYKVNRHADVTTEINQNGGTYHRISLGKKDPGIHEMTWDIKDTNGNVAPHGYYSIYFSAMELNYNYPERNYPIVATANVNVKEYKLPLERVRQIVPEMKFDSPTINVKSTDSVTGSITVAEEATINVWVVNNAGRHVKEVITHGKLLPGKHNFTWDGKDFMNSASPNANYFLNVYVRDRNGVYGEIIKSPSSSIKLEGSYDIVVPQPVRRVRVREDNTEITVGPYIQGHVLSKGQEFPIIDKLNYNSRYQILVADGVAGQINVDKVDLLDLDLIPLKWGQAKIDYLPAYQYMNHIVEEYLPIGATVRILEDHDSWLRVLLTSGKQAFVKKDAITIVDGPQQPITHTVQSGDTLWKIATKYGVTVDAIITANKLVDSNNIIIGQKLIIPKKQTQIIHEVASGDTLWKIASKYTVTVDAILTTNKLTNANSIIVGQRLIIPSNEPVPQPVPSNNVYMVKSGDTLWKISQSQSTPIDTIIKMNNLDPAKHLMVGQTLYLPEPTQKTITYTVKAGDTLWKIAEAHGTTIRTIADYSKIDPNQPIMIGQQLIVPVR